MRAGFAWPSIGIVDRHIDEDRAGRLRRQGRAAAGRHQGSSSTRARRAPNTMVARALAGKAPVISNDSRSDPRVLLGERYAESGIRSIAVFPLIVSDEAVGVLALYAGEPDFFHEEEVKQLTELAGDIAFALDHLDKRERLDYLAYYDVLTGLANRSALPRAGGAAHARGHRRRARARPVPDRPGAVQERQRQPRPAGRRRASQAGGGVAHAERGRRDSAGACGRGSLRRRAAGGQA